MHTLHETNPNVVGGGCLCSGGARGHDTTGPFLSFDATEAESNISPFSVLCAGCPAGRAAIEAATPAVDTDIVI